MFPAVLLTLFSHVGIHCFVVISLGVHPYIVLVRCLALLPAKDVLYENRLTKQCSW